VFGLVAGPVAAQAPVTGRWAVRFSTGGATLRGDLRLQQSGSALTGSLALESSDGPPVLLVDGQVDQGGELHFALRGAEPMRLSARPAGATMAGQATLERGSIWSWSAQRLPDGTEYYAALPRFRSRQLVLSRNISEIRLPGAWVAAAAGGPPMAVRADSLAVAAGLPPVPFDSVGVVGFLPALGLYQRAELLAVLTRSMTAVRDGLPDAQVARFDALFRPRGVWQLDLHDAALTIARRQVRGATWDGAQPALDAAGLIPPDQPAGTATVPLALYRLAVRRERDSAGYQAARDRLSLGGPASAQAAEAILDAYRDAALWQAQALEFLLTSDWVRTAGGRTSPAGLVRAAWGRPDLSVPRIRPRFFGYPEAIPRVATPPALVGRIVEAENWSGQEWALRRGPAGVLAVLRQLELGVGTHATLEADGPSVLTSVAREAGATSAGFLESESEIIEDPGNVPLLAVATAVHEWQHVIMEGDRLGLAEGGAVRPGAGGLTISRADPFLAEGFAEWMARQALAPVFEREPIVGVGEARKLVVLEAENPSDAHVLGLRMLEALNRATGSAAATRALVLAHADDPFAAADAVPAWRGAPAPDVVLLAHGERRLVPETRFTVEDGVGDVTATWIRVAP